MPWSGWPSGPGRGQIDRLALGRRSRESSGASLRQAQDGLFATTAFHDRARMERVQSTSHTNGEKFSPTLMLSRPAGPSRSTQGLQRGPWSVLRHDRVPRPAQDEARVEQRVSSFRRWYQNIPPLVSRAEVCGRRFLFVEGERPLDPSMPRRYCVSCMRFRGHLPTETRGIAISCFATVRRRSGTDINSFRGTPFPCRLQK